MYEKSQAAHSESHVYAFGIHPLLCTKHQVPGVEVQPELAMFVSLLFMGDVVK
jgi:hypothetical protein